MAVQSVPWFDASGFMPHGHCFLWSPPVLAMHVVSDLLIGLAYMAIPFGLYSLSRRRRDLPFGWLFACFSVFIVSCGLSHWVAAWNVWHAEYWIEGLVKSLTAAASVPTAILLWRAIPAILQLPSTAQLAEANAQLNAFTHTMSHDLRAPLRSMAGFSQALREDYGPSLDATAQGYLARISSAAERMDRLISDLLAYSRLGRHELSLVVVDLEELVRDVLQQLHPAIAASSAAVRVRSPLQPVLAHRASLTHCVQNLVDNALKYVPRGVAPDVEVSTEPRGGRVRLWVEDQGIGVAPEFHARIFETFERLHAQGAYEGAGMGLAIVRRAAERMGGACGIESRPGGGARVWIELAGRPAADP
jgi:signal transduction histidine kinase